MNEAIVARWNSVVEPNDTVYLLGDVMLGGPNSENGLNDILYLDPHGHKVKYGMSGF